jgi:hypothetical protein
MNEVAQEINGTEGDVPDERPIVAILIPCYKHFHPRMNTALNMLVDYTRKSGKARVFVPPQVSGRLFTGCATALLCELIKSGRPYTHVLMIDDDMVPKPDDLVKLLVAQRRHRCRDWLRADKTPRFRTLACTTRS